jgi:pectate lyase
VKEKKNVIIRNLGLKKVLADNGDAIGVRKYTTPRSYF